MLQLPSLQYLWYEQSVIRVQEESHGLLSPLPVIFAAPLPSPLLPSVQEANGFALCTETTGTCTLFALVRE